MAVSKGKVPPTQEKKRKASDASVEDGARKKAKVLPVSPDSVAAVAKLAVDVPDDPPGTKTLPAAATVPKPAGSRKNAAVSKATSSTPGTPAMGGEVPRKKRPKKKVDIMAHRSYTPRVVASTRPKGNYVHVCGFKGGAFAAWLCAVNREGHSRETFSRPYKEKMEAAVADSLAGLKSPEAAIAQSLGVDMVVARRSPDGGELPQSEDSAFPWMQYIHILKPKEENTPGFRREFQQKLVDYLHSTMKDEYTYPLKYTVGVDYTSQQDLVAANVMLRDKDAAELFSACFPITDPKLIPTLLNSTQIDDYFVDSVLHEDMVQAVIMERIRGSGN